ncbi:MAG TPA: copper resistance protein CopC [Verrucomicrobiae bacterium]|nr:copper resistance protein CopC [Verrucomicrobiae bacterium]
MKIFSLKFWIPAVVLFLMLQSHAWAHAQLYYSVPRVGSTVTNPPSKIKICFTEPLEPHGSTIQVRDARDKQVDKKDSHRDSEDASLLFVSLPKLPPGKYKVSWTAVSQDKHQTEGHFEFTIK